ncbi:MAG TPA: transglutaminase domain-containing protein [Candidatus Obscuribacterales bacterium]
MFRTLCLLSTSFGLALSAVAATSPDCNADKVASFRVNNSFAVKVPPGTHTVRVWFTSPQEDAWTSVKDFAVKSDFPVSFDKDALGNRVGYIEIINPTQNEFTLNEKFDVTRREQRSAIDASQTRPLTDAERAALALYLQPTKYVVVNDRIKNLATSITGGEQNPILAARKLYDWTYKNVDYWVKDPEHHKASAVGSTEYCLSSRTGNCSDFHSLFTSLAMSVGIPTRIVYGSLLKPVLNGENTDASYHCWVEFFAPRLGWLPLDPAMANMYAENIALNDKNKRLVELTVPGVYHGAEKNKVDYYFGNLDDRRIVWSRGRDLMMQPAQDDGPVNALIKMYVEIDGKQSTDWTRKMTYEEIRG